MNKYLKFRRIFKYMSSSIFESKDVVVMVVSYLLSGVFYDLGMNTALNISGSICIIIFVYNLCLLFHGIVIILMKRRLIKNGLYDFEKDNELNLKLYKEPLERD